MLISLAVDYQTADVATRERFHVPMSQVASLYARLQNAGITDKAIIATCNRTELYAWCPDAKPEDERRLIGMLARAWMPSLVDAKALLAVAVPRINVDAATHAVRVAAGLESQVLGDGQILGQFRVAYGEASAAKATGPVVNRLFETGLRAAKRVRSTTMLGSGTHSVGAQAAALASRRFGNLVHTRIVIVGCGKTGERVARQLFKNGARDLVFLNRTQARAEHLAREMSGRSAPLDTVHAEVAMADIAMVATGSETPLLVAGRLAQARSNCVTDRYPLLLVDLSMPRNIDVGTADLPHVTLVDLDALRPQVSATEQSRRSAIPAAEAIVDAEVQEFTDWLAVATAREAIRPFRDALVDVCMRELSHAAGGEMAERLSKRIAAKLLARPMHAMKSAMARGETVSDFTRTMSALFSQPATEPYAVPARAVAAD